jgi:hypothetical protein
MRAHPAHRRGGHPVAPPAGDRHRRRRRAAGHAAGPGRGRRRKVGLVVLPMAQAIGVPTQARAHTKMSARTAQTTPTRLSACSTRSPRRADPTSLSPGQFISERGAIVSRHSATQSLLKRSITGINQVSSYNDRRQPIDTISFASRSQRGFIPFRCPMGIRPRTSRPLSSCFRPLEVDSRESGGGGGG